MTVRSQVAGCGAYLPERVVTNHELAGRLDTSDEWIRQRTGIGERRVAAPGELTSDLAVRAADRALSSAGMSGSDLDLLVLATATPDNTFPATAAKVQARLGMRRGAAFDVQAVCAGFIFALSVADNAVRLGQARTALVVGGDVLSHPRLGGPHLRPVRRRAGAVVLQAIPAVESVAALFCQSPAFRWSLIRHLYATAAVLIRTTGSFVWEGREVFRQAVHRLSAVSTRRWRLTVSPLRISISLFRTNQQPDHRWYGTKTRPAEDKIVVTIERRHTSAASSRRPRAAVADWRIKPEHRFMEALGALSWGRAGRW
jgi:3-oxoacyl-[acyl-carrier-protein] synthase-3